MKKQKCTSWRGFGQNGPKMCVFPKTNWSRTPMLITYLYLTSHVVFCWFLNGSQGLQTEHDWRRIHVDVSWMDGYRMVFNRRLDHIVLSGWHENGRWEFSIHCYGIRNSVNERRAWDIRHGNHYTASSSCVHCKNWGVKMTPVVVNRWPHPQVLKITP